MYFDQAASDANHAKILEKTFSSIQNLYANPSVAHRSGKKTKLIYEQSLETIADYFKVEASQIIINSGATEANNHLLKALYESNPNGHMIISPFEHASILATASYLQSRGMRLSFAPIKENGKIDEEKLLALIRPETFLVSIVYQESEMGIMQNPSYLAKKIKEKDASIMVHSDITQALGKTILQLENLDFLSFSGHKIGSMKGIGALITPSKTVLKPLIHGGKSFHPSRSGTVFLEGLISMAYAFEAIDEKSHEEHCQKLNQNLRKLLSNQKGLLINSPSDASSSILNISTITVNQQIMQRRLKEKAIDVSIGSACTNTKGSQAVYQLYKNKKRAQTALRISLSPEHQQEDIIYLSQAIKECLSWK